jgi:hypothetical protein
MSASSSFLRGEELPTADAYLRAARVLAVHPSDPHRLLLVEPEPISYVVDVRLVLAERHLVPFGLLAITIEPTELRTIRGLDAELDRREVVALDLVDGGAVENDRISGDASDSRPMHRRERWRMVPALFEGFAPGGRRCAGQLKGNGIESAPGSPAARGSADTFSNHAGYADRFELVHGSHRSTELPFGRARAWTDRLACCGMRRSLKEFAE